MDTAAVGGVLAPFLLDLGPQLGLSPLPIALSLAIGTGVVSSPIRARPFIVAYSFRYARMGPIRNRDVADFPGNTHRAASIDPLILANDWLYLR